jgi:hypothetical protein
MAVASPNSSDGSDHSPSRPHHDHSSDAASTDSSSSDADEAEALENEYGGTQEETLRDTLRESDYVDVIMNEPEVLETDSDCVHLRAKLGDPGFVRSYSAAVSWKARSWMQSSNGDRNRSKVSACFSVLFVVIHVCSRYR